VGIVAVNNKPTKESVKGGQSGNALRASVKLYGHWDVDVKVSSLQ